jgi:hypothetical protein
MDDPSGPLRWLAKEEAGATVADAGAVHARGPTFGSIVRQRIKLV